MIVRRAAGDLRACRGYFPRRLVAYMPGNRVQVVISLGLAVDQVQAESPVTISGQ